LYGRKEKKSPQKNIKKKSLENEFDEETILDLGEIFKVLKGKSFPRDFTYASKYLLRKLHISLLTQSKKKSFLC
jgi:hypothetical protein